ncbi:MAG: hypothetical protein IJ298_07995 [Ruminococcus sp.]|nr:hypothetical protein [Ruminococcus sp.]
MKGSILVSSFCGVFAFFPCYLVFHYINMQYPLVMAFSSATLFACLLLAFLLIHEKVFYKKVKKLEDNLPSDYYLKVNGNFYLGRNDSALESTIKNCNVYFYENQLVIMNTEKPYNIEYIPNNKIAKIHTDHINTTIITTIDNGVYFIKTADAERINDELMKRPDWFKNM